MAGLSAVLRAIECGADPARVMIIDKMSGEGADYGGSSLIMGGNYLHAAVTRAMTDGTRTVPVLLDPFTAKGGQMLFGTKAWKLNQNETGVCGVRASDASGYFNIAAKRVIMAAVASSRAPGCLKSTSARTPVSFRPARRGAPRATASPWSRRWAAVWPVARAA